MIAYLVCAALGILFLVDEYRTNHENHDFIVEIKSKVPLLVQAVRDSQAKIDELNKRELEIERREADLRKQ